VIALLSPVFLRAVSMHDGDDGDGDGGVAVVDDVDGDI
jgi:hypothetical protein